MKFMALGGADRAGASCYYLELAGQRFLLDCGRGLAGSRTYTPDYDALLRSGCIQSLSQLDAIFLSHGHFDHLGALPLFTQLCPQTPIYATTLTRALGDWLLWDHFPQSTDFTRRFQRNLQSEAAMERILTVSYGRPLSIGGIRVTFFEAGHVPGAAMIYFESVERNVLYTGDFMPRATYLTAGCCLPESVLPDVVILCGTHAQHPYYSPTDRLRASLPAVTTRLTHGVSAYVNVRQLTKGVETVRFFEESCPGIPLYLSDPVWSLAEQLGCAGIPVLFGHCYRASGDTRRRGIHIGTFRREQEGRFEGDFTLHAVYAECVELLRRFRPSHVFVVHSPPDRNGSGNAALRRDCPGTAILYPAQGHLYADHETHT